MAVQRFVKQLAVAAFAGLLAIPAASAGEDCWKDKEFTSGQVRELQTRLMVAALQCRHLDNSRILANYNSFIKKFKLDITRHNDTLKARFIRQYGGPAGTRAFDRFTTQLANSYGASVSGPDYCPTMEAIAQELAELPTADLEQVARLHVPSPGLERCTQ